MPAVKLDGGVLGVGQRGLHALRQALTRDAAQQAPTILQEVGYASGEQVYAAFTAWLAQDGVTEPGELDANALAEALSEFFAALGWGTVSLERVGTAALALDSSAWGESQEGAGAPYPSCFLSAGLFSDFMGRLAGHGVSVMEVECRSRGDARCRFLVATPEILQKAYDAMVAGQDYSAAI
jgi:predicted hydrocarbon binding protein